MRKQKFQTILTLAIIAIGFSACGPSEKELVATSAAEIAAEATSTPTVTPTNTLIPTSTAKPSGIPITATSTPDLPPHLLLETCLGQIAYFMEMEEAALYDAVFQDILETFPILADIGEQMSLAEVFSAFHAAWSPDDQQIAFVAGVGSGEMFLNYGIFLVELGGDKVRRLVPDRADVEAFLRSHMEEYGWDEEALNEFLPMLDIISVAANPTWSPDGQKIAFAFGFDEEELYVINADGSDLVSLGNAPVSTGRNLPIGAWSPDSQQFLFATGTYGYNNIVKVNSDGSGLTPLTEGGAYYESPIWTTDGRIVFVQNPEYTSGIREDAEIYIMNADGSELVNLTSELEPGAVDPFWLEESEQIYFRSYQDGGIEYYVVNPDGSGFAPASNDLWRSEMPRWTQC